MPLMVRSSSPSTDAVASETSPSLHDVHGFVAVHPSWAGEDGRHQQGCGEQRGDERSIAAAEQKRRFQKRSFPRRAQELGR